MTDKGSSGGALGNLRILEVASLGPGPFCAMMLSDHGADILRIDRPDPAASPHPAIERGRMSVALDLKNSSGAAAFLKLVERADGLIEGYRPGVMERLGLGPEVALARNPRLVYGRMTGWGQTGPLSQVAGHDPNYLALTGALHAIGPPERPALPLDVVGDYGGGGLMFAFGMLSALWHARETGEGQVVDAAIVDGVMTLMTALYGRYAEGVFTGEREGPGSYAAPHFSGVYKCADGGFVAVCAFEPKFYAELLRLVGVDDDPDFSDQFDASRWPALKAKLAERIARRTRDEWGELTQGRDACIAPVLSMTEALRHPHNVAREAFTDVAGMTLPSPSPRLSVTPAAVRRPPPRPGANNREGLLRWGVAEEDIARLYADGALRDP